MTELSGVILGVVGAVLSLVFSYFPLAKTWFDKQPEKGFLMLLFVVVVALVYFGIACTALAATFGITVSCDASGAMEIGRAVLAIAVGNQLAYLFAQPGSAKA